RDLHVREERNERDLVDGLAVPRLVAPERRPEADAETDDAHPEGAGSQEVPGFVHPHPKGQPQNADEVECEHESSFPYSVRPWAPPPGAPGRGGNCCQNGRKRGKLPVSSPMPSPTSARAFVDASPCPKRPSVQALGVFALLGLMAPS